MHPYETKNASVLRDRTGNSSDSFNTSKSAGPVYDEDGVLILNNSFAFTGPHDFKTPINLEGQYFVEGFMVWESFDNTWMCENPLVLRFEDFDLVVSRQDQNAGLNLWQGSLDTQACLNLAPSNSLANKLLNGDYCMRWLRYTPLGCFIGNRVVRANLQTAHTSGCIEITFDNGSTIQIKNDSGLLTINTRR